MLNASYKAKLIERENSRREKLGAKLGAKLDANIFRSAIKQLRRFYRHLLIPG